MLNMIKYVSFKILLTNHATGTILFLLNHIYIDIDFSGALIIQDNAPESKKFAITKDNKYIPDKTFNNDYLGKFLTIPYLCKKLDRSLD